MCFNKTAALLANKVSLWLQPDEQTSRLLAGIQLQLGTASLPASCLALSLTHLLSLSHTHKLWEIERGQLSLSLSLSVRVCMTHPVSYTHLLLDTSLFLQGKRENCCLKTGAFQNICAWIVHQRAHIHTQRHTCKCTCTQVYTHTTINTSFVPVLLLCGSRHRLPFNNHR